MNPAPNDDHAIFGCEHDDRFRSVPKLTHVLHMYTAGPTHTFVGVTPSKKSTKRAEWLLSVK